ncbi:MAG: hypothetical protein ACLPX9_21250 [Rhodomicrobium sp.]
MQIVYLDQNKWIKLAAAAKQPCEDEEAQSLFGHIRKLVDTGRLALPLTFSNIYETQKRNNPEQRRRLAYVQAQLSRGFVIRGRLRRLKEEVSYVLADCCGLVLPSKSDHWFLSDVFLEAVADWNDTRLDFEIPEAVVARIRSNPAESLLNYLTETGQDVRASAVMNFSKGCERLRALIEERRRSHAGESLSMRRRLYCALLMIEDIEWIIGWAHEIGLPWRGPADMGSKIAKRLMDNVPTYYVEREIALRLEAQKHPIEENDFRDMQSFCAAIPYADIVIGEKQFVNLAWQAKLDRKYNTLLATDFSPLKQFF